jgi:hypothetical protein
MSIFTVVIKWHFHHPQISKDLLVQYHYDHLHIEQHLHVHHHHDRVQHYHNHFRIKQHHQDLMLKSKTTLINWLGGVQYMQSFYRIKFLERPTTDISHYRLLFGFFCYIQTVFLLNC